MFIIPCYCLVIQHLSRKNYLRNPKSTYIMKKVAKRTNTISKTNTPKIVSECTHYIKKNEAKTFMFTF